MKAKEKLSVHHKINLRSHFAFGFKFFLPYTPVILKKHKQDTEMPYWNIYFKPF